MIDTASPLAVPSPARRRALTAALPCALFCITGATSAREVAATGFDHRHEAWDALLKRHVVIAPDGNVSTVRYAALTTRISNRVTRAMTRCGPCSLNTPRRWGPPRTHRPTSAPAAIS